MLDIVVKNYNNIMHSATKYKPNEIIFSYSEDLFKKVKKYKKLICINRKIYKKINAIIVKKLEIIIK